MPCHAMPCHAMPCHAMPCHAMPYHTMPCHTIPYHDSVDLVTSFYRFSILYYLCFKVSTAEVDPLVAKGDQCPRVNKIRIGGAGCDMCVVHMVQGGEMWYLKGNMQYKCKDHEGFANIVPDIRCEGRSKATRYFGNYNLPCIDSQFSCTSSADATTQFWFVHIL